MTYHDLSVELPPQLRPPIVVERPAGSGTFVRLNDSYLQCIVYLGIPDSGSETAIDPVGTGFLMVHKGHTYVVTAAHVAKELTDIAFGIRLNRNKDIGQIDRIDSAMWYGHPDTTVDVAVMPYVPPRWAVVGLLPTADMVATEFKRESKNIGVGDLAYVVGIFNSAKGEHKNVPVVHTGHIASMADGELLETLDWRSNAKEKPLLSIRAYLIQAHTTPASSGSPVFIRRSVELPKQVPVQEPQAAPVRNWSHGTVWLLGLWHGAWISDVSPLLALEKWSVTVGTGMGICIPAPKILEVLDQPELEAMRKTQDESKRRAQAATPQLDSKAMARVRDEILRAALNTAPIPQDKPKAKTSKRSRGGVSNK